MAQDWLFWADHTVCDVRVVGVLVRGGKILVQRDADGSEYALPGGHIRVGETLEEGLAREYREETGAQILCDRMLWSEECFWEWKGRKAHNLAFYYRIRLAPGSDIPDSGEFVAHRDNSKVVLGWLSLEEIPNVTIYPEFLKEALSCLDGPIRHFVSKE